MKYSMLLAVCAIIILGCDERAITPDSATPDATDCEMTGYMPLHVGDYWIYNRIPLDSYGNPVDFTTSDTILVRDSLVVVYEQQESLIARNDGSAMFKLLQFTSKDAGATYNIEDTLWVTSGKNVLSIYSYRKRARHVFSCGAAPKIIEDTSYTISYPTMIDNKPDSSVSKFTRLKTANELLGGTIEYQGKSLQVRNFHFQNTFIESLLYPLGATFTNNSRTRTIENTDEIYQMSKNRGIVHYRMYRKYDSPLVDLTIDFPYGYENTLLRYSAWK